MKFSIKNILLASAVTLTGAALQSCASEEPFGHGEGVVRMQLKINSDVTRAAMNQQELADNCVVYISNQKGLVFKEKGLSNLPEGLKLRYGNYVAEAWTGDSVPASFDSKFYRCYEPFELAEGDHSIVLNCKIANVVASVNAATIDDTQIKNLRVTVSTSNGSLEFTKDNFRTAKGYFMMPYDENGVRENVLNVKVEGENILGEPFIKTRTVQNVKSAYEYVVGISYDSLGEDPQGGGYITISIDERENLVADTVEIFAAPLIAGIDFDIDKQIMGQPGKFSGDKVVKVVAFDEITSFTVECRDAGNLNLPAQAIDLKLCDDATVAQLRAAGISWDKTVEDVENDRYGHKRQLTYITFSEQYLNSLPARDTEYRIVLTATDGTGAGLYPGKTTTKTLRIAVGDNAVVYDDPIIVDDVAASSNPMAVGARRATLGVSIKDASALNPGVRYREASGGEWTTVPMSVGSRADVRGNVVLTGLKPNTRYEYQAVADGFTSSESHFFTTESVYSIVNAGMEDWSTYSASTMLGTKSVVLPGATGDKLTSYWGSGNEGAATANKIVLNKTDEMKHSGNFSARLASSSAVGVIAAGNIFTGYYVRTDGTNGVLSLGREYNGSHPTKVKVYANYRPGGSVQVKGNDKYVDVVDGGTDQGQIYVALVTDPVEIRTNPKNRNLFPAGPKNEDGNDHPDYSKVVAYGQVTWDKNFGADGVLEAVEIPFIYTDRARQVKPKYLVIVASASKFGDFFCGSESSVMCLDDFELVYE